MNRRALVVIICVLLLGVFATAAYLFKPQRTSESALETTSATPPASMKNNLVRFHSPSFGQASAPVTIVEFFDPSCEACRSFYPYVKNILAEDTQNVRLALRYVLFHEGSEEVVRMLEASRKQNLFPQVLEVVLKAQPQWHDDLTAAAAWDAAAAVGLDVEKARKDMYAPAVDAVLAADKQDVQAVGIKSTPTFFVNGRQLMEYSPDVLRQMVREEVAKSRN
ncbi:thioredoxin domain-containing protein [Pseudomonas nitroreducens]|uniref:Thioredoxin domain-containing protein n=1 Tax=Pseudomonas nitroreducens TaxID=46680 RepID=A0ABS0KPA0_PSENT|nr:thioredoxin domain-containing protein [Pseudomonas nitroreducens]MBG6289829.1 thioredoxin domain-containing protein [Pseudomonas nitroreducens]MDG9857366.1 thioredoxin domain-containing protein [Pseudomonas nitroreducens]MDH1076540.1 thioredoxin domain-containing protein [Pseudomonas nitroreducens]